MRHLVDAAVETADDLRQQGPAFDRDAALPASVFLRMARAGLLAAPIGTVNGGMGLGSGKKTTGLLLEVLTAIGSGDLSVGRLFEGHVNALLLVERYGTTLQRQMFGAAVTRRAELFGVWNTDSGERLTMERAGDRWRLSGGKSFASGAGLVGQALVTAELAEGGRQMVLVPMAELGSRITTRRWRPSGMRASMSYEVDFSDVTVEPQALLGRRDQYLEQPWFSAGCARFAAVQLGGALALLRVVHAHLRETGRQADPYQVERFAGMRMAVETGRLWLARAAAVIDEARPEDDPQGPIIAAQMARRSVEQAAELVLELGTRSVGMAGMLMPHPLERLVRDLSTYLRQPAPDAAFVSIGEHALAAPRLPW